MNRKGFTLVELIATIVILALVMAIASYSITALIKNSKDKNYELLVQDIKAAAETYYIECKYNNNSDVCTDPVDGIYTVTLGDLVEYGHLKGNSKDSDDKYTLVNPKDDVSISECIILISYSNQKVNVTASNSPSSSCPTY